MKPRYTKPFYLSSHLLDITLATSSPSASPFIKHFSFIDLLSFRPTISPLHGPPFQKTLDRASGPLYSTSWLNTNAL